MIGRNILFCLTTVILAWKATAFLSLGPCLTPDACKSVMGHGFKMEYVNFMRSFLIEGTYAIENAAIGIRDGFPIDNHNRVKLTATAEGARELRGILEDPESLNDEKLAHVIERIQFYFGELTRLDPDGSKTQPQVNRVTKAWQNFCEGVVGSWGQASILTSALDTSLLPGFDGINADVAKTKDLPATGENQDAYSGLMGRILEFFAIDKSLMLPTNGKGPDFLSRKPCLTPDSCKSTMSDGFNFQYRSIMTAFLSENLYAIENAAIAIRDGFPLDDHNHVKLTATAEAARELRKIVEDPKELNDEKLAHVIERVQFYWGELTTINTDRSKIQSHLDRVAKAWQTFCEGVVRTWGQLSLAAGVLDTSKLSGFDGINTDVTKTQGLPATGQNQDLYNELAARILQFFRIDNSLIYQHKVY